MSHPMLHLLQARWFRDICPAIKLMLAGVVCVLAASGVFASEPKIINTAILTPGTKGVGKAEVTLPHRWDGERRSGRAQYEVTFTVPEQNHAPWSLYIPRIGNRFQIALNGTVIASNGVTGNRNADYAQHPHLIAMPSPPLRSGGNILEVMIDGDAARYAGLSTMTAGPTDELRSAFLMRELAQKSASIAMIALAAVFAAIAAAFTLRTKDFRFAWFAMACVFCAVRTSWAIVIHPPMPYQWWGLLVDFCYAGYVIFMVLFCMDLLELKRRPIILLSLVVALVTMILVSVHAFWREPMARQVWLAILILYTVTILSWS